MAKGKWWQGRNGVGLSGGLTVIMVAAAAVMMLIIFVLAFNIFSSPGCGCIEIPVKNVNVDVQRVNESAISVKIIDGSDVAGLIHSEAPGPGSINVSSTTGEVWSNYVDSGSLICSDMAGSMQYFAVPSGTNVTAIASFKDGWQQIVWTGVI